MLRVHGVVFVKILKMFLVFKFSRRGSVKFGQLSVRVDLPQLFAGTRPLAPDGLLAFA